MPTVTLPLNGQLVPVFETVHVKLPKHKAMNLISHATYKNPFHYLVITSHTLRNQTILNIHKSHCRAVTPFQIPNIFGWSFDIMKVLCFAFFQVKSGTIVNLVRENHEI